ncbi:MAG TPA: DoxX family membrane protein [Pyrinomonadaceae bacterium]|jgi:uncharacterized membrane protein
MTFFLIIIAAAAVLQLAAKIGLNPQKSFRENARLGSGFAFMFSGVSHFLIPEKFMSMMPPVLPAPLFLVYLSGVFEVLGGIGLMIPAAQKFAAIGLIALLVAVFPANIYVALNNVQLGGVMNSPVYQWLRLPMQFALIAWVWWSGRLDFKIWRTNYES